MPPRTALIEENTEQRAIASVRVVSRQDLGSGRYRVTIAANEETEYGPKVDIDGLKTDQYMRNPIVLYSHDRWDLPIGRTVELIRSPGRIDAIFEFLPGDERAARVRNAWDQEYLNGASITWDLKTEDLLEWSIVTIPADPDALRVAHARMIGDFLKETEEPMAEKSTSKDESTESGPDPTEALRAYVGSEDFAKSIGDAVDARMKARDEETAKQRAAAQTEETVTTSATTSSVQGATTSNTTGQAPVEDAETMALRAEQAKREKADLQVKAEAARKKAAVDTANKIAREAEQIAQHAEEIQIRRATLIKNARPLLDKDFNTAEATEREILENALGADRCAGKSDDYCRALLELLGMKDTEQRERVEEERSRLQNVRIAAGGSADYFNGQNGPTAYEEMVSRQTDAWKE